MSRYRSLKWPLIIFPLFFNLLMLLVSFAVLISVAVRVDSGGPYADEQITRIIAAAIVRHDDGSLAIRQTPQLMALRGETADLWFVVEDDAGRGVSLGRVPELYRAFAGRLADLSYAQLRDRRAPYDLAAVVRRETGPAGPLTILAHGKLTELGLIVLTGSNLMVAPTFLLLVLTSLIVTPWIVRRSLAGLSRIAQEADQIDAHRRGRRLNETHVPKEIVPLVTAVNDALRRLDEGYEQQRRFIASAAHELRTPIAILAAKVEVGSSAVVRNLAGDVQRLATLTEQLLDIQRLDTDRHDEKLDLGALVRRVVAELVPLLIAAGRTIEVEAQQGACCRGDAPALERVVTNLIQNAVEHGGYHIVVRVAGAAFEVEDDGPGIPPEERERVFEPFHRLRPRSTGSGLGLNLVQQVVERHGGRATILAGDPRGMIARVELRSC
ncbi:sensor histidine kinase [Novosphingobium guangzhouense]|uniref:histidine kinase n=1 Tax=Novosphingobium guangzhouense TaxID=1850347 RepID=A0A2K2FY95_9SPHN|nr:HAMP domain-containing sensor histidine kinase [Novosphingobium guangzhouense]PNU03743.1 two-component sensor histidine kinase [Novosphingobium guangzhouense]